MANDRASPLPLPPSLWAATARPAPATPRLAEQGMTMIVVTHEMGFARRAADRVLFMADGRIVEEATPAQFFDHPQTDRAKDFLSKILEH